MAYSQFRDPRDWDPEFDFGSILDADGSPLYETEYGMLIQEIVKRNDVALLKQYLEKYPRAGLCTTEVYYWDSFFVAASHGSIDALRVLLEHYNKNIDRPKTVPLDKRGFLLLNVACQSAHVETVRFLLDSDPPLGNIHDRDRFGETAILSAASSLANVSCGEDRFDDDSYDWVRDRIARGEELIHLLLDRGASVHDTTISNAQREGRNEEPHQPLDSVLGLAISQASYNLVKRLVDSGADVHTKQQSPLYNDGGPGFGKDIPTARDITALHLGGFHWNTEGIQAVLDHRGDGIDIANMVSVRDTIGRTPLHWAATGSRSHDQRLFPEDEIASQITDTFKLLLDGNPSTINIQDSQGATALHYAAATHALCGSSKHAELAIRFLCERGADAGFQDINGQTALHRLAFYSIDGDAINTVLLDLLLSHGADINHPDKDGNTALHIMARHYRQAKPVQHLLNRGADISIKNSKGNTPLHEGMRGIIRPLTTRKGRMEKITQDDKIRAQDEMIAYLLEAGDDSLMDHPNILGETPRQLFEETRERWQRGLQSLGPNAGMGRGRPLNRG